MIPEDYYAIYNALKFCSLNLRINSLIYFIYNRSSHTSYTTLIFKTTTMDNAIYTLKKLFACFFMFLIFPFCVNAKALNKEKAEECNRLLNKGVTEFNDSNYSEALENFIKAEFIAEKEQFSRYDLFAKYHIGMIYMNTTNFGDALQYFMEALAIAKEQPGAFYEESAFTIVNSIALLYFTEKDYDMALEYYKPAYLNAIKKKSNGAVLLAVNISDLYNKLGNYKEARKYLMETKKFPKSDKYELGWQINYAETLLLEGRLDEAKKIMNELLITANNSDEKCYGCVAALLSRVYTRLNKPESAISFAKMALENTAELHERMELYNKLSMLYFREKDFSSAFKYKDSLLMTKDSISASIKRNLFEMNKVKLKVQEYKSELISKTEKQEEQRAFFLIIILLSSTIFIFIYRALRGKIIRQTQEKIIIERNQDIVKLELEKKNIELEKEKSDHLLTEQELETIKNIGLLKQEQLKNQIAEKNREISAKALYLSIRNDLIEDSIDSLNAIPEISKNQSVANHINVLKKHLKSDSGWDDFINQFEKVNPVFIKALKEKHPSLNGKDVRFISCIYMNLEIKEISNIFNVTYNAANKRKQRIKEKMGIHDDAVLYHYLLNIV